MASQHDPILVLGATGQQGGAVARELLARGHRVRALTRAPDSLAARRLAERGATVFQGDLDDPASVRSSVSGARAVFSVHTHVGPGGVAGERRRGIALAEAAMDAGVDHVVYTSVDGAERDSGVPHFQSKWAIEQRLRELGCPTTVLRPTGFMENFAAHARPESVAGTLVVRLPLRPGVRLQMIAVADIGVFAADAFERRDDYIGQAVALAGDELTGPEIAAVFQAATSTPARYEELPLTALRAVSEDLALMWEWIASSGHDRAEIAALRVRHPDLRTLADWVDETDWRDSAAA